MGQFETSKIRNLGIIAHGGAGKTSLSEAILFDTGMIDRLGRVDDGTSTMDFEPEEIKRKISITSALDHCEWKDIRSTLLTPRLWQFHCRHPCLHAHPGLCSNHSFGDIRGQSPNRGALELGQ